MNINKNLLKNEILILILFLIFSFGISENMISIQLKDLNYSNNYTINSFSEFKKFKVIGTSQYNYLNIKVEGNFINPIISYYQQDNYFKERKQLSQSLTNTTKMWLTKEQIEKDFYFSVECSKYPCSFKIELITSINAELIIGEQYTYYITEKNKKMNFILKSNIFSESLINTDDYILTIWAVGSKEFNSNLEGGISEKPSNHHYYRINLTEFNKATYNFIIEGEIGDYINIGLLLFKYEQSSSCIKLICQSIFQYNGLEIKGYFNINEKTIFKMNEYIFNLGGLYDLDYKYNDLYAHYHTENINGYYEVEIEEKNYNCFYNFKFIKEFKYHEIGFNNNFPLILGNYYFNRIKEGEALGLIPMNPEKDFIFLNYEIIKFFNEQEINIAIYHCDNYPLCHHENSNYEKKAKIENINSFHSYTYYYFNKEDFENITPISKKQNLLLITCENGINIEGLNLCYVLENIKTNENNIILNEFVQMIIPIYKFIMKNDENKYFIPSSKEKIYLNIEIFSGEIEIIIEPNKIKEFYQHNNKFIYILSESTNYNINIKGNNNSIYTINNIHYIIFEREKINPGANYFINIKNNITIRPGDIYEFPEHIGSLNNFCMGIYPINCKINIDSYKYVSEFEEEKDTKEKRNLIETKEFYQEKLSDRSIKFIISNSDSLDFCLCYISYYGLDEKNGIILSNNSAQLFSFSPENNILYFSYIQTQKENDIIINLILINSGNFTIDIYLNKIKFISYKDIESNKEIVLKSNDLNNNCINFKYYCQIKLLINSKEKEKKSILNIKINSIKLNKKQNNGETNENDDDDKTKEYIIISCCSVVILIIIVAILVVILKTYKRNIDLSEKVNSISFEYQNKIEEGEENLLTN